MQPVYEFSPGMPPFAAINSTHGSKLVLATVTVVTLEVPPLLAHLQESGFIGVPLNGESIDGRFLVGAGFFELITFMGCSPYLALEPPADGGPFCYIQLEGPWPQPQFRYGVNTQWPRCSSCRGRMVSWREFVPEWIEQPQTASVVCPRCKQQQRPLDLGWRHAASFGNLFVVIENVFPGEAAPVPAFLAGLGRLTATNWDYFYLTLA